MTQLGLIHPSDLMRPEWLLTGRSLHAEGLIVEHHIEPADEGETSGLSHHLLCMHLNSTTRQVTHFEENEYDGAMSQGSLWLLPAQQSGFWHWESSDECLLFMLDPQFLQRIALETECFLSCQIELLPFVWRNDPQMMAIATLFLHELTTIGTNTLLYQESLANILAIHLLRNYCGSQAKFNSHNGGLSSVQLKQVIDYINSHLSEDISLNKLAAQVHLSVHYFGRLFRQSTGKTPHQYVTHCRLERAKQLLKQTDLNVIEVAAIVGFQSHSHFITLFRQQMQVTPLQFRKSAR
jgi:AraC family transcriptional regulator